MVVLKKQFLAFLRDAVLHKFYCKFEKVTCKHSKVKSEVSLKNGIYSAYKGSYMSAHVLLNLLNELRKSDKMRGLPSVAVLLFRNELR